jgi:hypothetical protein
MKEFFNNVIVGDVVKYKKWSKSRGYSGDHILFIMTKHLLDLMIKYVDETEFHHHQFQIITPNN